MLPSERIRLGWCQDAEARDAQGVPCEPDDARARSWCATAAIALWPDEPEALETLVEMAFLVMDEDWILDRQTSEHVVSQWNDAPERTLEEVAAALQGVERAVGVGVNVNDPVALLGRPSV